MRRKLTIFTLLIGVLFVVVFTTDKLHDKHPTELTYNYDASIFHTFFIDEKGYVVFNCDITVKNNSNKKQLFTMKADVSKEMGLTMGKFAFAYKDDSESYEVFEIEPNTEHTFPVKFKALSGNKKTKSDRLPPKDIIFILQ